MDEARIEEEFLNNETNGEFSTESDLKSFIKAYNNEKISPDLLSYESFLVLKLKQYLQGQKDMIDKLKSSFEENIVGDIYLAECNRISFMLADYHRARLFKIQKYALGLQNDESYTSRLSKEEVEFNKNYLNLKQQTQYSSFLNKLPKPFRKFMSDEAEPSIVELPDLKKFVFCKVDESLDDFRQTQTNEAVDQNEDLKEGDVIVTQYERISGHILANRIRLL